MMFEERSYALHPGKMREYLTLFEQEEGVLDRLRPYLRGFWIAESGSLNTVHHLWGYESRSTRAVARAAMAADPAMVRFLGKAAPMLKSQRSRFMTGEVAEGKPDRSGGVYDRLSLRFRPDADRHSSARLCATLSEQLKGRSEIVGALYGSALEAGHFLREAIYVIRFASAEDRERIGPQVETDLSGLEDRAVLADIECKFMMPAPFSPWR